jgi:hypothetical protein
VTEEKRFGRSKHTPKNNALALARPKGKLASRGIQPWFGSSRRTKNGQRELHVLSITLFSNPRGRAVASCVRRESAVPLRPQALRAFAVKQLTNTTLKYAKDGHRHCSSFFLLTFSTCNILCKHNITLQGKTKKTMQLQHTPSQTLHLQICSGHAANTSGGEFRSPVLQVFAPARSHS